MRCFIGQHLIIFALLRDCLSKHQRRGLRCAYTKHCGFWQKQVVMTARANTLRREKR
ncbi:hypothetical protein PF005_g11616 [Phytophthora fragariae]|uniref:Uncharacterized protein n=1 Tax=Phytophthora fragariae TaxID=53985 RepID=A0A6A3Y1K7_9STRA|nr:hypothetical protein PF003_g30460 [Phytophthora fragariae]KAE8937265.1 hypothetical protein PF009_g12830 [Phytophthora fragariae]KAE9009167.1 hypothetical protein PF011_g10408 [Phytophthora fragariae]KAE9167602.1 hypothetical protein PF004_g28773 [Phytophthora fragariae]KAE9209966.1 hypothetical protein PF005_g11616 [Phytophthora fragariae]